MILASFYVNTTYRLSLAALGSLDVNLDLITDDLTVVDLGAHLELETLLAQELVEVLGELTVHTSANGVQVLNDSDLSAETRPDRAQLETNHTSANDDHLLGDLGELKSTRGRDDALLVEGDTGDGGGLGTGGDNDVLGLDGGGATVETSDLDVGRRQELAGALDVVDAVLLEKELDTAGKAGDSLQAGLVHAVEVELHVADLDTTALEAVLGLVVDVRVVQHGLGGDAADVQTGTTQGATLLDTGSLIPRRTSPARQLTQKIEPVYYIFDIPSDPAGQP